MSHTTMSPRQFADSIGRALSTVQGHIASGTLSRSVSRDSRGRFRIDPVVAAEELADVQLRVTEGGSSNDTVQAWRAARARREAALAALAEDELRTRRGELVEARGVELKWTREISAARNKLLGIPSRMRHQCPHLPDGDIRTLDNLIREALEDLANGSDDDGR